VDQLAKLSGLEIGKMGRLGASPSVLLPYFATRGFLAGHDFVVFDLAISDQGFLWAGAIDPYQIVGWLEYGIARAHEAGCIPIVLVIPHRATISAAPGAPVPMLQQLYRAVAQRSGALCFDLYDEIARRAARDPGSLDEIYTDPDHLSPTFAAAVARAIANYIERVSDASIERIPSFAALRSFDRVPLGDREGVKSVLLESSLLSAKFASLYPGDLLDVRIGTAERLAGALIDRVGSRGKVQVSGTEKTVKTIGTPPDSAHSFVAQLVPFLGSVRDDNGVVRVGAADPATPVTETSWQEPSELQGDLRIAELLVERRASAVTFTRPIFSSALRRVNWFG
jgi:hypothetical protein